MGKRAKNEAAEDYMKYVFKKVLPLFQKADREKLEKAIASGNLSAQSRALGVSIDKLQALQREGRQLAFYLFLDFLKQRNLIGEFLEFVKNKSH